jgi:ABC-type glycerol-3-phosphate transport system permease component
VAGVLTKRYFNAIDPLRERWGVEVVSFDTAELPASPADATRGQQTDLSYFVRDPACRIEWLSIYGPRQAFETWAGERGIDAKGKPLPIAQIDYLDFASQTRALRWEFFTRNFRTVIDFIVLHGNALWNTIIYCGLVICTNLLVNPLAAYALSRYRPPSAYAILLFCMCTMAFPAEVTMIPSFLLLKRFPLYPLLIGGAAAIAVAWTTHKLYPGWPVLLKAAFAIATGAVAGWWLLPLVVSRFGGDAGGSVSLLNTFWALVLPGMANGFSIFLLKGFFDSLPRELFESAEIDGANEWHKFWMITMSLSKPILAVLALGAFTAAYSEFMMALVLIPDPKMWTIMVWLFQMQSWSHPSVVYASLVVAAIPTLLIFIFCQNLIMRGIVVPTEK